MEIKKPESKQPMPSHAKLVFKGVIFDVYQWEQEMFDGTKKTFEKLKRADAAVVIPVTQERNILIETDEQPGRKKVTTLPAGRIEEGEDPLQAAERELLEETGYKADELIFWKAFQPYSKIDWTIFYFIGKGCKKVAEQNLDGGEKISIREVSFDELVNIATEGVFEDFQNTDLAETFLRAKQNLNKIEELRKLFLR